METRRSSHVSRSSCETSSELRQVGDSGHPATRCSGMTRPSSRMKSRHTSPQRASLRTPDFNPADELKWTTSPSLGGQVSSVFTLYRGLHAGCFWTGAVLVALPRAGLAPNNVRTVCARSRPRIARNDVLDRSLYHGEGKLPYWQRDQPKPSRDAVLFQRPGSSGPVGRGSQSRES